MAQKLLQHPLLRQNNASSGAGTVKLGFCNQNIWIQSTHGHLVPSKCLLGIWAGCQAICPAASPLGCDEQHLIQRLQQSVLATSIHSTPSSDFINAVELWDWCKRWHSPGKEKRGLLHFPCSILQNTGTKCCACCGRTGLSAEPVQAKRPS